LKERKTGWEDKEDNLSSYKMTLKKAVLELKIGSTRSNLLGIFFGTECGLVARLS
jgi:hypothetical protein